MPRLIFGIDPGNTIGIAAVDFSGKKVRTLSIQNGGISEAVAEIEKIGTPSLIACDATPLPDSVQKIAASFNAKVWYPPHSIREEEKRQVAQQYSLSTSSAHERDALTAAVYAYRDYQNRLRQIELLPDFSHSEKEELSHMFMNGFTLRRAIISLSQRQGEKTQETPVQKIFSQKLSPSQLESQLRKSLSEISRLSHENSNLKKALDAVPGHLASLHQKIRLLENGVSERLRRDSEVRKLRFENDRLKKLLERIWNERKKRQHSAGKATEKSEQPQSTKKSDPHDGSESGLNSLGENELESLVEEYRKRKR